MESIFKYFASRVALTVEAAAALLITMGALEALYSILRSPFQVQCQINAKKAIWLRFGVWLLLGLEFELAADVIRTAISPTWVDIGQLGAIAVIRTFLNFFLEKDLEKYAEPEQERATAKRVLAVADSQSKVSV
jgi:uncharacterized membrane protein